MTSTTLTSTYPLPSAAQPHQTSAAVGVLGAAQNGAEAIGAALARGGVHSKDELTRGFAQIAGGLHGAATLSRFARGAGPYISAAAVPLQIASYREEGRSWTESIIKASIVGGATIVGGIAAGVALIESGPFALGAAAGGGIAGNAAAAYLVDVDWGQVAHDTAVSTRDSFFSFSIQRPVPGAW